jgi:DNA-binding winged helix-turn-helix (wHTH) protein
VKQTHPIRRDCDGAGPATTESDVTMTIAATMEHKQIMSSNGVRRSLRFGPFELSSGQRVLRRNGVTLPLGARAFDILVYLAERPGEVIGNKELIDHVWPNVTVVEGSLRVHMAAIRKTLGDGQFGDRYIANVKGRGYSFIGSVVGLDDSTETVSERPPCREKPPESPSERPPQKNQARTLVLMLATLDSPEHRVHAQATESDDHVTKRFALAKLVARMEALARRPPDMTVLPKADRKLRRQLN